MSDALSYALATLGCGVRHVLGDALHETPRAELVADLSATFRGCEELRAAIGDAYTRALQSLVIGLKQVWLLGETGGEHDYCEAFGELRRAFVADEGIEGPLLLSFLDGFFIDYDTALDAADAIFGFGEENDDSAFFEALLDAGLTHPDVAITKGTLNVVAGLTGEEVGLEEEHPIVRFGRWRDLLVEGIHFHFTELCRHHPSWSRYLDAFKPNALEREEGRAIAKSDAEAQARINHVRALIARRDVFRVGFGEILPNLEWLFDIADRLEDVEENVESDLLKGRAIAASDLPKIVAAGVGKVHSALSTAPVGRLSDVLTELSPGVRDVLRRARRDFRRCHWNGEDYGEASLQLAGAMLPVAGPGAAERYYREAGAFGADRGTVEFSLFLTELLSGDFDAALEHLLEAARQAPDRYELFDFKKYTPQAILGAGGSGPSFLVETAEGERAVVKSLWDPVSVLDPRPGLKPLALLHKAGVPALAQLLHLGVNNDEFPYATTAFVEGDDFENVLEARGGKVPHMQVCMLGSLAARGLGGIHAAGSVHRNVKPNNLIMGVGEEGLEVTLLDPCIPNVLLAAPGRVKNIRRLMAWSCTGRVIAEDFAAYTAPEVVRGGLKAATPQSDLYALGGVLYRLATGLAPRQPNFDLCPSPLRPVLARCLSPRPEERPSSAEELAELLDVAADQEDLGPPAQSEATRPTAKVAPPPPPPPPPPAGAATATADPFAQAPAADPFAQAPLADPFAPAPADPFAQAPSADPFAQAPAADPFGGPAADPFAQAPAADPFAQAPADPFAQAPAADPFAQAPAADPFAPAGGDPFAGGMPSLAPPGGDPFAQAPAADPFAGGMPGLAPPGGDPFAQAPAADPFAPAGGDPFAPAGGDPFAPAGGDPFAGGMPGLAPAGDPFAQASADPFADPLAALVPADPFAALGMAADPLATAEGFMPPVGVSDDEEDLEAMDPGEALAMLEAMLGGGGSSKPKPAAAPADPFAQQAPADPFAAPGGGDPFAADPFAAGGDDPFAAPGGGDPFGGGGEDPFGPGGSSPDLFASGGGGDPFAAPGAPAADPFGAPAAPADPFAAAAGGDPFAAAAGGDPFAAAAGGDPFAAAAGGDPFAAAAGGDPFAAAAGGDPFAAAAGGDPFAAAAGGDPFAAAAGGDPFAAAASADPFAPPTGAPTSAGGLWLSADETAQPNFDAPAAAPPQAPPPKKRKKAAAGGAASYGVVVSGLSLPSKKEAAVKIICEIKGCSPAEAEDMCRSPVVPVLKGVSQEEAESAKLKFKAAKLNCRVTSKKRRR